jgi:dTDP-4-dehydrorhamnose reductase
LRRKKLLVLGASGLAGYKIAKKASTTFDVYGTYNVRPVTLQNCQTFKLDLTDNNQVNENLSRINPDVIINTTALHNVDFCEENKDMATAVNTAAIKNLLDYTKKGGSRLIHISTDYVFDGNSKKAYSESDLPNPVSFYGLSKLEGERLLDGTGHVVIRPSVVYGWTQLELAGTTSSSGKPMNFAMWLLTKLNKKEPLKIVTDQFASATLADSLAEASLKITSSDKSGIYHVSGISCESRYEFAIKLAKKFGYDSDVISKVDSSSFVQKAKRPQFSCLDCQKAMRDFGLQLLTTEDALGIMKNQVEKEAPNLLNR